MYFKNMLEFIDTLSYVFDIFAGIDNVKLFGKDTFLLNVFFMNNTINKIFWGITCVAVIMLLIFTCVALVRRATGDLGIKRPVGKILGLVIKTLAVMCLIPFCCLALVNVSSMLLKKVADTGSMANNLKNPPSIGTLTYLTFTMEASKDEKYNIKPSLTDELRADYMTGKKNYLTDSDLDFSGEKINYYIALPVCCLMIAIILICATIFIVRIFELLILYVTAPFFATTIIIDEGAKFREWCNMFIGRLLSGFGMVIMMKMFFIIVPIIMNNDIKFTESSLTDLLIKSTFMVGGLWATYYFGKLITQITKVNKPSIESEAISNAVKSGKVAIDVVASGRFEQKLLSEGVGGK